MVAIINAYKTLFGKPEGKTPLERPRNSWKDNIRMNLREVGWKLWTGFMSLRIRTSGGLL
jgi:hypothetical protein